MQPGLHTGENCDKVPAMTSMTVSEACRALGIRTRYALAKRLGISPSAANKWRRRVGDRPAKRRDDTRDPLPELRALQVEKIVREAGRTE